MLVTVSRNQPWNPCVGHGPDGDIEIMRVDGSGRRPIGGSKQAARAVNTKQDELWSRLSPDRRRFLFYRMPAGVTGETCRYYDEELWVANVDGSNVHRVFSRADMLRVARRERWDTSTAIQGHADWAPDGRHVVMVLGYIPKPLGVPAMLLGVTQLFVFDVETRELRQVTDRHDRFGHGMSTDPSYTPDGRWIVFWGCADAAIASCDKTSLLQVAANATRATRATVLLARRNGNDVYVAPNGRRILWMELGLLHADLDVAPFRSGRPIVASKVKVIDRLGGYGNWTADGGSIVFHTIRIGERFSLYRYSFDGHASRRLTTRRTDESFVMPSP